MWTAAARGTRGANLAGLYSSGRKWIAVTSRAKIVPSVSPQVIHTDGERMPTEFIYVIAVYHGGVDMFVGFLVFAL